MSVRIAAQNSAGQTDDWQVVSHPKTIEVVQALSSPARIIILELLNEGPIRQYELAKLMRRVTGKKYDDTVLRYHLHQLARAGLIGSKTDRESAARVKMIYRAADFELRLRPRRAPRIPMPSSETNNELVEALGRRFQGKICQRS